MQLTTNNEADYVEMRNGIFMSPLHALEQDPTVALHRDLELIAYLDQLGYEEAWVGEHHSGGHELCSSPEMLLTAAAMLTKRIKLGTGVISLPYHNPLNVANRVILLDHLSHGRAMFGAGPGLLASDAAMFGIDSMVTRDRMLQSLLVIARLFRGETVTETTDWYALIGARTHLQPFQRPNIEITVASALTPSGGRAAGKHGFSMLCVAATNPDGYDSLGTNWEIANQVAAEHGRIMRREQLRLVGPVYIAASREQARKDVQFGIHSWLKYSTHNNPIAARAGSTSAPVTDSDPIDALIEAGEIVLGTPDDAIDQIRRLQKKQGQFGAFLQQVHDWAPFNETRQSFQLWAEYVAPVFKNSNRSRQISKEITSANSAELVAASLRSADAMIARHSEEISAAAKVLSH